MKKRNRIPLVRLYLEQYAQLERKNTDEAGWIALKFSCSISMANTLIAQAKAQIEDEKKVRESK